MKNKIVVEAIASTLHIPEVEAKRIYEKAKIGGECTEEDALYSEIKCFKERLNLVF